MKFKEKRHNEMSCRKQKSVSLFPNISKIYTKRMKLSYMYLKSWSISFALYIVINDVDAAGITIIGVRDADDESMDYNYIYYTDKQMN